jgi:FkbM family methyltransferase
MLRQAGYRFIELIYYIRFFGAGQGFSIWIRLVLSRAEEIRLSVAGFKNPVFIRRKDSDPAIFFQIFGEQQYKWGGIENLHPHVIVDAGSNVGFSALFFAHQFPQARIYCIEPDPSNYRQLLKNTAGYEQIRAEQAALWPYDEKLDLKNQDTESASIRVEKNDASMIQGVSIPTLMQRNAIDRIHILKIDIEGAEKELFSGDVSSWLSKTDIIIIELHDMYRAGTAQAFFHAIHDRFDKIYIQGENIICYIKH